MRKNQQSEFNILDLGPTNPLMIGAWIGCIQWAIGEPQALAEFRAETGNNWNPGMSAIDQMIDKATGADRDFIEQFVRWVNKNIWGEVNGRACNGDEPESVMAMEEW